MRETPFVRLYKCVGCEVLNFSKNDNVCSKCGEKTKETVGRWVEGEYPFKWYDTFTLGWTWSARKFFDDNGCFEEKK